MKKLNLHSVFCKIKTCVDYRKKKKTCFFVVTIVNGVNEPHFDFKVSCGNYTCEIDKKRRDRNSDESVDNKMTTKRIHQI